MIFKSKTFIVRPCIVETLFDMFDNVSKHNIEGCEEVRRERVKVQKILYRNKGHYADVQDVFNVQLFQEPLIQDFKEISILVVERMSCKSPRLRPLMFAVALLLSCCVDLLMSGGA